MPPNEECLQYRTTSTNLRKESERIKTFRDWQCEFLNPRDLAKGGFYYTNEQDIVRCAFCGVEIGCWERGDDPDQDHKKWSSNCDFVRGRQCGNIPMSDDEEISNEEHGYDTCGPYGVEVLPFSGPERSALCRDPEKLGILKTSGPVNPTYNTYESRLKTFESWPKHEVQSPQKLAEAGFYYTKCQDNTICFHCGGGLKNWEVDDDPWVEHVRWFTQCGFVNTVKDREFIQDVISKKIPLLTAKNVEELPGSAKPAEEMVPPEVKTEEQAAEDEVGPIVPSLSSSCSSTSSSSQKEYELCRICYQREKGIVFLPCGHLISCTQCAPSLSTCPVCRKPYQGTVRAYLS